MRRTLRIWDVFVFVHVVVVVQLRLRLKEKRGEGIAAFFFPFHRPYSKHHLPHLRLIVLVRVRHEHALADLEDLPVEVWRRRGHGGSERRENERTEGEREVGQHR